MKTRKTENHYRLDETKETQPLNVLLLEPKLFKWILGQKEDIIGKTGKI